MARVEYDELEPSDDYLLMLHRGKPFDGIAFEKDENGVLVSETACVGGQKNGISREWSSGGILIREQCFLLNGLHGASRKWFENGSPKSDSYYEFGICLREMEWSTRGDVVKEYTMDEASPQFTTLKNMRNSNLGLSAENLPHASLAARHYHNLARNPRSDDAS